MVDSFDDIRKKRLLDAIGEYKQNALSQGAGKEAVDQLSRTRDGDPAIESMAAPIYEETNKIPVNDQIDIMNDRIKNQDPKMNYELIRGEGTARSVASEPEPILKGPIQGPPAPVYSNDRIKNEPMQLGAETPQVGRISDEQAYQENKPTPRQARNISNMSGDMMVGASHALLGLLSGNYNRAAMEYGKGNQFIQGNRAEDIKQQQNLKITVGPDGKPIYTPAIEAADMEVYQKPEKVTSSAGSFQAGQVYDPMEQKYYQGLLNTRTGKFKVDGSDAEVNLKPGQIYKPATEKVLSAPTIGGGKTFDAFNQYNNAPKRIASVAGRGEIAGGITKEEYDATIKGAEKGKDILAKSNQDIAATQEAMRTLKTTNDPMTFATTTGNLLRTAVGEKRLSDIEGQKYMGDDYKGFLLRGNEYLTSKYGGQIPDSVRRNAANLSEYVLRKMQGQTSATKKSYSAPSLSPKAQQSVKRILGTDQPEAPQDWKSKYGI